MRSLRELAVASNMSLARVGAALGVCGAIAFAQLWQCVAERDDWPLSSYPMYSGKQGAVDSKFSVFAVTSSGEIALGDPETRPLFGPRLNAVLSRNANGAARELSSAVCKNLKSAGSHRSEPAANLSALDVTALRVYRLDWKINPELKGLKDRGRLLAVAPTLCPERREALTQALAAEAPPVQAVAPEGSLVLEAEALLEPGAREHDMRASGGAAAQLASASGAAVAGARLRFEFEAPPGKYHLWLRVRDFAAASKVLVQINNEVGSARGILLSGSNNPAPNYPAGAYAWISEKPGYAAATVRLQHAGKQELVLQAEAGAVVIDQVLLTPGWSEHPAHNLPVRFQ